MKNRVVSFVLALLLMTTVLSFNVFAKDSTTAKAKVNYRLALKVSQSSLDNSIPGIVEGTIYNVVVLKKYCPDADYSNIIDKLNKISQEYPVTSIRYKAHLASMYLTMGNGIEVRPRKDVFEHEYLFKQIADQLETKLLVSN